VTEPAPAACKSRRRLSAGKNDVVMFSVRIGAALAR
jgi:hypothetical protein